MFDFHSLVEIFRVAGLIYLAVVAGLVLIVFRLRLGWPARAALTAAIIAIFLGLPGKVLYDEKLRKDAAAARAKEAWARYEARCKNAGVKIYRKVENIQGIYLANVRPDNLNFNEQFELSDPYGRDYTGVSYIASFLEGYDRLGRPAWDTAETRGFKYVDVKDAGTETVYRYTAVPIRNWIDRPGIPRLTPELQKLLEIAKPPLPKYGVAYEDISTREDREYWIAGSLLRVYDVDTREVLAERVGYMIDPGQGAMGGGRSPWLIAAHYACPWFYEPGSRWDQANPQIGQARKFVESVLRPQQ